jgi:hypothetical protein
VVLGSHLSSAYGNGLQSATLVGPSNAKFSHSSVRLAPLLLCLFALNSSYPIIQQANGALTLVAQSNGVATSPPLLSIAHTGSRLLISWPETAPGYNILQSSTNLNATNWTTISTTGNQFSAPTSGPMQFFRLIKTGD